MRRQLGLITREQAHEHGMTDRMIHKRLRRGLWIAARPGIYTSSSVELDWKQKLMSACLAAAPAAVSHRAAAAWWDMPGGAEIVEITTARRVRFDDATIHRRTLPRSHVRVKGELPVTDPTRTLCDLGAVVAPDRLEEALDVCLTRGLVSIPYIESRLARYGGKGVRGCGSLRKLLELRDPSRVPAASVLETRFLRLLRANRLPRPRQQVPIYRGGRFTGRVDFIYPERRLIIEADSVTWHSSRRAWERDLERRNHLTLGGWRVMHVTWFQIERLTVETVAKLRSALSLEDELPLRYADRQRT